ncbi:MAG: LITAF-like zinc ribbon domain-containing protein [Planctomycetes bacterium]|nr:LITAF-like zinc ribbon domain-containing protein [Planctomycetota bacterium]MCB9869920.1 LITAF-like zinc ribbon domain-containing protein [Planctomycetota bacterium]
MAKCPMCDHEGRVQTKQQMSTAGWIVFAALLLVCLPLCWIPFVVDSFKEEVRTCANCGGKLGTA